MTAPPAVPAPAIAQLVIRRASINDYYRRAIETPDYLQAIRLHEWATRERANLPPTPQLPLPDSLEDDLDEWRSLPKKLADAEHERSVLDNGLAALQRKCESRIQSGIHQVDQRIASVARDVDGIMNEARPIATTLIAADVHNAHQAIEHNMADRYQELRPFSEKLDSAFQAYDWLIPAVYLINHRSEYLDDPFASDTRIANLDEIDKGWKSPPQNLAFQSWDSRRPELCPADGIDRMIWFYSSGAQVRAATTRQLNEQKAQRMRDRAHPNRQPQQQTARQELNQAPRGGYFDRIVPVVETASPPPELADMLARAEGEIQ